MKRILIVFLLLAAASAHVAAQEKFPMITIPEEITEHVARAKYLGEHYWDNVDFNTASDEVLEQGFVDMVSIFMLLDDEALDRSWAAAVKRAEASKTGVVRLLALGDKYLYGVSSPMYNESAYRSLLRAGLVSKKIAKADKTPYQKQLVLLEMNNEGSAAVDFEFEQADGTRSKLSEVVSPVTILFFYDPDCVDCKIERFRLTQARMTSYLQRAGGVTVLAVFPSADAAAWDKHKSDIPADWINARDVTGRLKSENLYDLRAMPRIYLLDDKKQVLLKNTTAEQIETYLTEVMRNAAQSQAAEGAAEAAE